MMEYLTQLKQLNIGVLGLGVSGTSCVDYLLLQGIEPFIVDGDWSEPLLDHCQAHWPQLIRYPLQACQTLLDALQQADLLIVSPGIPLTEPILVHAEQQGVEIIGDVELFARLNTTPVVAITGSNGKSSVTTLTTLMLQQAGLQAEFAGNIGVPVMSILSKQQQQPEDNLDVIVLELSSFQLESIDSLQSVSATVLNVVEDHMDRYASFSAYVAAKQRIYRHSQWQVVNRHDDQTWCERCDVPQGQSISFGLDQPDTDTKGYGIREGYLTAWIGEQPQAIGRVKDIGLTGEHNVLNALTAIALVTPFTLSHAAIMTVLARFTGLPHRCQTISHYRNVTWINDSKGTNVGATLAAIKATKANIKGRLLLIVGGDSKQADFAPLYRAMALAVDYLLVFGEDGPQLMAGFMGKKRWVTDMAEAITIAAQWAQALDCVLLSPACASGTMFTNYIERGEEFTRLVRELSASVEEGADDN